MHPEDIKRLIEAGLRDCVAMVEGDDGRHFSVNVVSPDFIAKSRIQKQQLVYATINQYLTDGTLHAISIKTFTPEEWGKINHG
jgi:acid stress-induced BolA-like protein IbaG/YrbA